MHIWGLHPACKTWKVHTSLCTCAIPLERASGALPWRGASCRPWLPAARLPAVVPLCLPFPLSAAWWGHTHWSPALLGGLGSSHPFAGFDCSLCFQDPCGVMASLQTVFLLVCGWVCSLVHSRERGRHHLRSCAVRTCWVRAPAPSALCDSVTGDGALETFLNLQMLN